MDLRNLDVAVCKPDHLGDFVLALPALRQLTRMGCRLTLFIAPGNAKLARHLLPDAEIVALAMPYLKRDAGAEVWASAFKALGRLRAFDIVFFLRRDKFLTPERFAQWTDYAFFIEDRLDRHQTQLEHDAVAQVTGVYDVDALFFGDRDIVFPRAPRKIAFAIGAGFPHKKWSPLAWSALGHRLRDRGIALRLLSGPGEVAESRLVARATGLDDERDVFVSSDDFKALDQWLDEVDLVVAADGGSAHLASLRRPVVAVFGPSPYRRFAPTGAANRVVTRSLACSPCVGFEISTVNACLSRECLYNLPATDVDEALFYPSMLPGDHAPLTGGRGTHVHFGLSAAPVAD